MNDATRRVTEWIIGIRGEVPLVEELATAEDVQSFVCGHVRWSDGTPGPAVKLEDIDWAMVDWHFVLKVIEFIPIKSLVAMGSDEPGSYVGHSRVPSRDR